MWQGHQPSAGGKPCFYIAGDEQEWDSTPALMTTKNFLIGDAASQSS